MPPPDLVTPADLAPRVNGVACTSASDCKSGFCVDSVCCNSDCSHDACRACNLASSPGICTAIPVGGMPASGHATCGPDAKSTCNRDGTCDGSGACRLWAGGTVCGASSCNSGTNMFTSAPTCDGKGVCKPGATLTCAPYVCKDTLTCWPSCMTAAQCLSPNACNNSSCGPKVNGAMCGGDSECASGFCTDGYCCNARCNGQCQACDLGGANNGMCLTVSSGQPHGTRPPCPGTEVPSNGCAGQCDGAYAGKCDTPQATTICVGQSCTDATHEQQIDYCNGMGYCATTNPISCGQFICSGSACLQSCSSASDCAAGAANDYCDGQCHPRLAPNAPCSKSSQCYQYQPGFSCCCEDPSGYKCEARGCFSVNGYVCAPN